MWALYLSIRREFGFHHRLFLASAKTIHLIDFKSFCWRRNLLPSRSSLADWITLCSSISVYFALFIVPATITGLPDLLLRSILLVFCHHCASHQTQLLVWWTQSSTLILSDHSTLFQLSLLVFKMGFPHIWLCLVKNLGHTLGTCVYIVLFPS